MKNPEQAEPAFSYGYKRTAKDFTFTFNFSFEALAIIVFAVVLAVIGLAHACGRTPAPATVEAPPEVHETELGAFPIMPVAMPSVAAKTKPERVIVKAKIPTLKKVVFEGDNGARDERYIKRFQKVAILEMQKFGVPASIKMAQGLLESQGGQSELTRKYNNHFGIKCHARSCAPGHCANYKDDSHKDFFRAFGNAWESWRAHSLLLQGERYAHLKGKPYQEYAHGLKKAGYATDKRYAYKIINIIERYDLTRLDRGVKF
jgi:flagellum-specific peptidoglycan hydrolase FlgJ